MTEGGERAPDKVSRVALGVSLGELRGISLHAIEGQP
jgi:hypothetical protein